MVRINLFRTLEIKQSLAFTNPGYIYLFFLKKWLNLNSKRELCVVLLYLSSIPHTLPQQMPREITHIAAAMLKE